MSVVSNTSPLVFLERVRQLDLLQQLFEAVAIPAEVAREIARGDPQRATPVLPRNWIGIESPPAAVLEIVRPFDVDPGEAEAIALALANRDTVLLLIDDRRGRRAAERLGLRCLGTAGLLVLAKESNLIDRVGPLLEDLIAAGMHLAPAVREHVLLRAGE